MIDDWRLPIANLEIGDWNLAIKWGFLAQRVLSRYAARHGKDGNSRRAPAANIP